MQDDNGIVAHHIDTEPNAEWNGNDIVVEDHRGAVRNQWSEPHSDTTRCYGNNNHT